MQLLHPPLGPVDELYGSGLPIRFSAARAGYERPPPRLGEHNEFVYGGLLGYGPERIESLRSRTAPSKPPRRVQAKAVLRITGT